MNSYHTVPAGSSTSDPVIPPSSVAAKERAEQGGRLIFLVNSHIHFCLLATWALVYVTSLFDYAPLLPNGVDS